MHCDIGVSRSIFKLLLPALALTVSLLQPFQATAADREPTAGKEQAQRKGEANAAELAATPTVTRHQVRIGNRTVAYTATVGELPVQSDSGETEAHISYFAYSAENPESSAPRPLLFIFNGGPGAASVWLHLGAIGPMRVEMLPDGNMPAPPFHLVDNAYSWLDQADLVFIDPVGTGYSRAAKPELTKNFTSVRGDIESLGKFVRLYLSRSGRWSSPIYLVGESYGTFRCAGISEYLVEHGVALNGIVLISSILNLQTTSFDNGNDLPYQLFLPSYTATAWYHKKLAPELQADLERTLRESEAWAAGEYQWALNKGDRLTSEERREVAQKLARFTGLGEVLVENRNLRIDNKTFTKELLRDRGEMIGYMDSRFKAPNLDPSSGFDPTVTTIRPPFSAAFNSYVRDELGYRTDREYLTLGGGIGHWDWETKNGYADTSDNLRNTLAKNRYMKVFIASAYFDLATPHFATEYTVAHLGLNPELRRNIIMRYYKSGHMMYLERDALAQLKGDVSRFLSGTLPSL